VSIVSLASVADVGRHAGDEQLDPRRFRMLIEIDGVGPYEEDGWQGRRVRVGDAIVRVGDRMNRCVMTTLDPDTGEQNAPVLDALATYRKVGNATSTTRARSPSVTTSSCSTDSGALLQLTVGDAQPVMNARISAACSS
jgi:uncharacterized protein YcbX